MHAPYTTAAPAVKVIAGTKLSRARTRHGRTFMTLIATGLVDGSLVIKALSKKQAASITGVRMVDIGTVQKASPPQYAAMCRGETTVEDIHQQQVAAKPVSNQSIMRMIERVGPARLMDALDELTKPLGTANGQGAANGNGASLNI